MMYDDKFSSIKTNIIIQHILRLKELVDKILTVSPLK